MGPDRGKNSLPSKLRLTPDDLVPGRSFTTLRKGHDEETVVLQGMGMGRDRRGRERYEVRLVNPATQKTVVTDYERFINGRIGMSRVIDAAPLKTDVVSSVQTKLDQPGNPMPELGTDMVVVVTKDNANDEVFTVVSRTEDDCAILALPESLHRQMFRIPTEDLLKGESEALIFKPVNPKFSLLKEAHEKGFNRVKVDKIEESGVYSDGPAASRDVRGGEIIGGLLPPRTLEERLQSPEGVFVDAIDAAARSMLTMEDKGSATKGLALLLALKGGHLINLPFAKSGA